MLRWQNFCISFRMILVRKLSARLARQRATAILVAATSPGGPTMCGINRHAAYSLTVAGTLLIGAVSIGQETIGISVSGRGRVKAAPTTVELTGTISAEAELTGDAL